METEARGFNHALEGPGEETRTRVARAAKPASTRPPTGPPAGRTAERWVHLGRGVSLPGILRVSRSVVTAHKQVLAVGAPWRRHVRRCRGMRWWRRPTATRAARPRRTRRTWRTSTSSWRVSTPSRRRVAHRPRHHRPHLHRRLQPPRLSQVPLCLPPTRSRCTWP